MNSFVCVKISSIEQYAMRSFAEALDDIPLALAENSGLSPIQTLAEVKALQLETGNSRLGIDCMLRATNGSLYSLKFSVPSHLTM